MQVRLHKFIAEAGLASRRAAERLMREGRVWVNGRPAREPGLKVDPRSDQVLVDGQPVRARRRLTVVLYKPAGYICSRARQTPEILAAALGILIETDPLWMERHAGKLQGLPFDDPSAQALGTPFFTPYIHFGQTGESELELMARGARAVQSLIDRGPGRYLVVSHGALLNRALFSIMGIAVQPNFQGFAFGFGNTAFATLLYRPQAHKWRLLHFEAPAGY